MDTFAGVAKCVGRGALLKLVKSRRKAIRSVGDPPFTSLPFGSLDIVGFCVLGWLCNVFTMISVKHTKSSSSPPG